MTKRKPRGATNAIGDYRLTPEADMRSFDSLPPRVRAALRDAPFDIAAPQVRSIKNHDGTESTLLQIAAVGRDTIASTRLATWGDDYPAPAS